MVKVMTVFIVNTFVVYWLGKKTFIQINDQNKLIPLACIVLQTPDCH